MRTTPLTTLTSAASLLSSQLRRVQDEATKLQSEVSSGRLFDVGRTLGSETGALVAFKQEAEILRGAADVNKFLAARVDASQSALGSIVSNANEFLSALMSARGDPRNAEIVLRQAEQSFQSFVSSANTSHAGVYLFSGINTTTAPFTDYFSTPPPASKTAVDAAFLAEFGLPSDDPGVVNIPASSMQAFIDTTFSGLFSDAGWSANWTTATVDTMESSIGPSRQIATSVSAQEQAFRKITAAYALVTDSGLRNLNEASYQVVIDTAAKLIGEGVAGMGELQGILGSAESEIEKSSEGMGMRLDLVERVIGQRESVDLSDVSVRLNTLLNQLEASYVVTGRIQNMSLLKVI